MTRLFGKNKFNGTLVPMGVVALICVSPIVSDNALAAGASAYAGVTISSAGSVGTVPPPSAPEVTPAVPTTTAARSTASSIPIIPISTTSNIGFYAGETAAEVVQPRRRARAQAFTAMQDAPGSRTAVAVAGAPNQTYSVILPHRTSFVDGGAVVSLGAFMHDAGTTPSLDAGGADVFNIGAAVESGAGQSAAENRTATDGAPSVMAAAFTQRSPFVNVVVSYN